MHTTLNKIRAHAPCAEGWEKLLKHLGKTKADDEPLSIKTILKSNGVDDAIWCLRAVDGKDKEIRLFAVWCARQVQHIKADKRSLDALDVVERFANGLASEEELRDAGVSQWSTEWQALIAAYAAAYAARDAAGEDAGEATWDAAYAATRKAQAKKLIEICEE